MMDGRFGEISVEMDNGTPVVTRRKQTRNVHGLLYKASRDADNKGKAHLPFSTDEMASNTTPSNSRNEGDPRGIRDAGRSTNLGKNVRL
jgi:hypothetical protein